MLSEALEVGTATIERVRQRFVVEGMQAALTRQKSSISRPRKLDGEQEAYLIALIYSKPEEGRERWTLQMLADKLVELHLVESIARRRSDKSSKRTRLLPWQHKQWCIPPKQNAAFV